MTNTAAAAMPDAEAPDAPQIRFDELGLSEPLLRAIRKLGWEKPTRVQALLIPEVLRGRDVLGQSQTGTGKTAAFGLPLLQMIEPGTPFAALILVPTRELAIQVGSDLRELSEFTHVHSTTVYGGQRISVQADRLKKGPEIIVGTPGRVMDMHGRGALPYDRVRFAILDEVDRMLDIGFRDDIRRILGTITQAHQTIFVSATISDEIEKLARRYMHDPVKLVITTSNALTVAEVKQAYFSVERWDKKRLLVHLLEHEDPALTLVFCRTKQMVDALSEYLVRKNIDALAIHGDMYQSQRNRVMERFRRNDLKVLVASDLAARGLDVDNITHVVNYDLPEDPEVYVHRVGRTARAGRGGEAWSFVSGDEGALLNNIERLANVEIPRREYPDFEPGPVPADVTEQRRRDLRKQEEHRVVHSRVALGPPTPQEAADPTKFPGGIVPKSLPARRLGGRLRSTRR